MAKKKNKVNISQFRGMEWADICKEVKSKGIVMVMSKDRVLFEAGKASGMCNGEAGAAIITAGLCCKHWNPQRTAARAVEIYDGFKKKHGMGGLEFFFREMQYWTSWTSGSSGNKKWPVSLPEWEDDNKWGGLANVMLSLSASEMADSGQNTDLLAAKSIVDFLREGSKLKEEHVRV